MLLTRRPNLFFRPEELGFSLFYLLIFLPPFAVLFLLRFASLELIQFRSLTSSVMIHFLLLYLLP